jgi:Leucine-rich repeat (LRR) protein
MHQTLKDQTSLEDVSLDGVKTLSLNNCSVLCLAQIPDFIEKVVFSMPWEGTSSEEPIDLHFAGDAPHDLELWIPKEQKLRVTRWPGKLKRLQLACHFNLEQLPTTIERLSLWQADFAMPLQLELPSLVELMIYSTQDPLSIEALPTTLQKLSIWSCKLESLPKKLPKLQSLDLSCMDCKHIPWKLLPTSLESLGAGRCWLQEPTDFKHLPKLKRAYLFESALVDVQSLLELPDLEFLDITNNPLSEESEKAITKRLSKNIELRISSKADIKLTRQLFDLGINLSAENRGKKKIRLNHPLRPVCSEFDRKKVEELIAEQERTSHKLVGQAFIERLQKDMFEEKRRIAEERKAARKAKKLAVATTQNSDSSKSEVE